VASTLGALAQTGSRDSSVNKLHAAIYNHRTLCEVDLDQEKRCRQACAKGAVNVDNDSGAAFDRAFKGGPGIGQANWRRDFPVSANDDAENVAAMRGRRTSSNARDAR
jgi:hypothetical protein